jgi:Delta6-protoilludene synthase
VVEQAIDRSGNRIRDIQSYTEVRRRTIGAKPAFALLELGLDIPDEVMSHPAIRDMVTAATDMICLSNVSDFSVDMAQMVFIKMRDRTSHPTT